MGICTPCKVCFNQMERLDGVYVLKTKLLSFYSHASAMWIYEMVSESRAAWQPTVYQMFTASHLSYMKILIPMYRFRAITFFDGATIFKKRWSFCQKKENTNRFLTQILSLVMDQTFTITFCSAAIFGK